MPATTRTKPGPTVCTAVKDPHSLHCPPSRTSKGRWPYSPQPRPRKPYPVSAHAQSRGGHTALSAAVYNPEECRRGREATKDARTVHNIVTAIAYVADGTTLNGETAQIIRLRKVSTICLY